MLLHFYTLFILWKKIICSVLSFREDFKERYFKVLDAQNRSFIWALDSTCLTMALSLNFTLQSKKLSQGWGQKMIALICRILLYSTLF